MPLSEHLLVYTFYHLPSVPYVKRSRAIYSYLHLRHVKNQKKMNYHASPGDRQLAYSVICRRSSLDYNDAFFCRAIDDLMMVFQLEILIDVNDLVFVWISDEPTDDAHTANQLNRPTY